MAAAHMMTLAMHAAGWVVAGLSVACFVAALVVGLGRRR